MLPEATGPTRRSRAVRNGAGRACGAAARARRPAWSSTSHSSWLRCAELLGRVARSESRAARGRPRRFWGALIAAFGVRVPAPHPIARFMFVSSRGIIVSGCVDSPGFARAASRCPPTTPCAPCHRHLGRDGGDGGGRFRLARSETLLSVSWMRAAEHVRESRQPLRVRLLRLRSRLGRLLAAGCRRGRRRGRCAGATAGRSHGQRGALWSKREAGSAD
jgi:hypothetical protein